MNTSAIVAVARHMIQPWKIGWIHTLTNFPVKKKRTISKSKFQSFWSKFPLFKNENLKFHRTAISGLIKISNFWSFKSLLWNHTDHLFLFPGELWPSVQFYYGLIQILAATPFSYGLYSIPRMKWLHVSRWNISADRTKEIFRISSCSLDNIF